MSKKVIAVPTKADLMAPLIRLLRLLVELIEKFTTKGGHLRARDLVDSPGGSTLV